MADGTLLLLLLLLLPLLLQLLKVLLLLLLLKVRLQLRLAHSSMSICISMLQLMLVLLLHLLQALPSRSLPTMRAGCLQHCLRVSTCLDGRAARAMARQRALLLQKLRRRELR